jgi:riboflavin biosynthesis pyrimidine reductase
VTQLLELNDAGIVEQYLADERPPHPSRPWVTMGMISSLDGGVTVDGRSTGLGGPPDRAVFRALRAVSDVVLVGAETLRAERYRAVALPENLVGWRRARGMADNPQVAVVSRSLDLELTESLAQSRPLILTCDSAPIERRQALAEVAEVILAGTDGVEPALALSRLQERGMGRVILEGGPTLNGQMLDLIDEACVTIAPLVAGGTASRIVAGSQDSRRLDLRRAIHSDGFLLLRYLFR